MGYIDWVGLQPAFIALVGALVGGGCAIYGVYVTHENNLKEHEIKEENEVRNFLKAIHSEILTIWERYSNTYKVEVDGIRDGQWLNYIYPIKQDYFTVYNNNTHLLGKIQNNDLRKRIVVAYTQAKGLIDSLVSNNESLEEYNMASWEYQREQSSISEAHMYALKHVLLNYAPKIKEQSIELEKNIRDLIKDIDGHTS